MRRSIYVMSILSLALVEFSLLSAPSIGVMCSRQDARGAQDKYSLKVDVSLVTVDVTVRDRRGAIVDGLQAGDFSIYDNGALQEITHLSRDQLPLAVALVVDCSPSIRRYLKDLRGAALAALSLLKPEDRVALFSLALCPSRLTDLTQDHGQVVEKIGGLEIEAGTNIYDSLAVPARYLREQAPDRRHAIILISDDYSEMSQHTAPETLKELLSASATLLNIHTPGDNGFLSRATVFINRTPLESAKSIPDTGLALPDIVARIARETGGEVFSLGGGGNLSRAFQAAISNLKLQYTLGFVPSEARTGETFHKIEVKLQGSKARSGYIVQARSGYYRGSPPVVDQNAIEPAALFNCGEFKTAYENKIMSLAARNPDELHDILFKVVTAKEISPDGAQQIGIHLKIDSSSVRFRTVGAQHMARLRVGIVYADPKGHDLGSEMKTIDINLGESDFGEVKRWGIPFSAVVPLKVPKQVLKIVVFDPAAGKLGSKFLKTK